MWTVNATVRIQLVSTSTIHASLEMDRSRACIILVYRERGELAPMRHTGEGGDRLERYTTECVQSLPKHWDAYRTNTPRCYWRCDGARAVAETKSPRSHFLKQTSVNGPSFDAVVALTCACSFLPSARSGKKSTGELSTQRSDLPRKCFI